jgi:NADH:ubiquinone oxidoreductase subunit E
MSKSSRYSPLEPPAGSAEIASRVDDLIADLQPERAGLLTAFRRIQHEYGYVPEDAVPPLADRFATTPAAIFGAMAFYSEVRRTPPARTTVEWCSGPACLLKGSLRIRRALEAVQGCDMNGTTDDGAFGLRLVQCDGTCQSAPLLRLDGRYVGPLSVSEAIDWARELKANGGSEA